MGGPLRLTDTNEEHLGFVLMAEDYPVDADTTFEGDCVFMPLPQRSELFEGAAYLLLAEHQDAGEHRYQLRRSGTTLRFVITGPLERIIQISVGPNGWGEWGYRTSAEERIMGTSHRVRADRPQ